MVDIVGVESVKSEIDTKFSALEGAKAEIRRKIAIFFFEKITVKPLWDSKP